jgi:hypothetical protein
VEEVDNVRTRAEESINTLLENFMGINDAELGACVFGMHCKETMQKILKQIFPGKELRGYSPNSYFRVSVRFIYSPYWSAYSATGH